MVIPAIVCTDLHLVKLESPAPEHDPVPARKEEASNVFSYVNRILYTQAVLPGENVLKTPALVGLTVANAAIAALQSVEGTGPNL